MGDKRQKVVIGFGGGWATDLGPSFPSPPQNGSLLLPFLLDADNVLYELDGGPHKIGGVTRFNSTAITGSPTIGGFADFWLQGTGGSETQRIVAYAGTQLWQDQGSGSFISIKTGLTSAKEPCFAVFNDKLYWASNSFADTPQSWNGSASATSNVGGSPPTFSFMVVHKNRMWAAGVASNPSRLYYSNSTDAEDWIGGGSIDIDPSDGDRITGIRSHKNELLVFKGPNRLSIHRITGSSPSGSDAFARVPFVVGVGSVNHNGIFAIGDDVVFPSPRGLHSLAATAAFGDYVEAFLSRPWLTYYQDSLNHTVLAKCWGGNYQSKGLGVWTFAPAGSSSKTFQVGYDYRFQPGRWITLGKNSTYQTANCLGIIQVNRVHRLMSGDESGFLNRWDASDRSLPSSGAYTAKVTTPYLNFGSSAYTKIAEEGFLSIQPKGAYNLTFGWQRDTNAQQTATIAQGGSDTLG